MENERTWKVELFGEGTSWSHKNLTRIELPKQNIAYNMLSMEELGGLKLITKFSVNSIPQRLSLLHLYWQQHEIDDNQYVKLTRTILNGYFATDF